MATELGTLRAVITASTVGLEKARERAESSFASIAKSAGRLRRRITVFSVLKRSISALLKPLGDVLKGFSRFIARLRIFIFSAGAALGSLVSLRQELVAVAAVAGGVATNLTLEGPRERLRSVADAAGFVREEMEALRRIANRFGQRVTALAGGFSKLVARGKEAGLTFKQLRAITAGVVASGDALGRTGDDINSTLETFSNLAQQDRVELEKLASSLEFTNDKYGVLAEALGKSREEIKELIEANATLSNQSLVAVAQQLRSTSDNSETLSGAFNRLFNTFTKLLQIFNKTGVIQAIIDVLNKLRNSLRSQGVIEAILRLGEATTEFIRGLPAVVRSVRENWNSILDAITTVAGALIGTATGGPFGGIIGAVVASNDALRKSFFSALQSAAEFAFRVTEALNGVQVGGAAQEVAEWLKDVKEGIASIIKQVKEGNFKSALKDVISGFKNALGDAVESEIAEAVKNGILNGLESGFEAAKEGIKSGFSDLAEDVKRDFRQTNDNLVNQLRSLGGDISSFFGFGSSGESQGSSSTASSGSGRGDLPPAFDPGQGQGRRSRSGPSFDELASLTRSIERSLESLERSTKSGEVGREPFKDLAEPGGFDASPESLRKTGELRLEAQRAKAKVETADIRKGTQALKEQKTALEQASKEVRRLAKAYNLTVEQAKRLNKFSEQIGDAVASSFTNAIVEGKKFEETLQDILKQIQRIILKQTVGKAISGAVSQGVSSIVGSFANSGSSTTGVGAATPNQQSGFASGGVATEASIFGEGKQAEAAVPLPDGRAIPVKMQGKGSGDVVVNVINQSGEQLDASEQSERQGPDGNKIIDVAVKSKTREAIIKGDLDKAMSDRFGLSPRHRRR